MSVSLFLIVVSVLHFGISAPSHYKPLSAAQAARLAAWSPNDKHPMWELSGQYEGDMVFMPGQLNGVIDTNLRWPNKEIPYEIFNDFTKTEKQFISESLEKEYSKTCIKVRPKTDKDKDYVRITGQDTGCWSQVGRVGGQQILNLQRNGCLWYGTIAHEMLHAAGFYHQQSATERDDYVEIIWDNISEGLEYNFSKYDEDFITNFGEKYDYGSIMHYHAYAFSKNGEPTIIPKDSNATIGQNDGLSPIDIAKLNKMYKCV